jgi:hypothetical protein
VTAWQVWFPARPAYLVVVWRACRARAGRLLTDSGGGQERALRGTLSPGSRPWRLIDTELDPDG